MNADIHWPADYDARFVGEAVLGTLCVEADGGPPAPGSAIAVERADGGRRWRVTLRPGATWSDGRRLAPQDALRSARAILERPRSAPARLLYPHGPKDPAVETGPDTLEYRFDRPVTYAPALFTLPQFAPSPPAGPTRPVLGPYEISERTDDAIVMVLRDTLDNDGSHRPSRLEFRVYETTAQALQALARGDVDVSPTTSFSAHDVAAHRGHPGHQSRGISLFGSLEFGKRSGELVARPDLRRALGRALDREDVARRCPGLVIPFLDQTAPWCPSAGLPPVLPPTAREIEAVRRELGTSIEIGHADFVPNGTVVGAVCDQLADVFGIMAVPRPLSYHAYVRSVLSRDHGLLYTLTAADFPHPAALLSPWRSDAAGARRAGFADTALDRLLDAASEETDPAAQQTLWSESNARWADLMPRIPLIQVRAHCVHSGRVSGVRLNSTGLIDFRRLATDPDAPTADGRFEEARA
ncbi:ABC transporter substrate-binding protein [Streptomyces sp. NPDC048111]|uniref:ABC transporter substrate-binding protein n=1 Tax=Streptomyces sp. NPDC048111 TaxID=3365500 RepID=UPI0037211D24